MQQWTLPWRATAISIESGRKGVADESEEGREEVQWEHRQQSRKEVGRTLDHDHWHVQGIHRRGTGRDARGSDRAMATRLHAIIDASAPALSPKRRIATEAGVKTLVLSHFVPGGHPFVPDDVWYDAVRPHFPGSIVVGRDLLEV